MRSAAVSVAVAVAAWLVGCTPTVNVAAPEPIVIQLNITHEVRVRIEKDVDGLLSDEENPSGVSSRGVGDPASADARALDAAKAAGSVGERVDGYLGVAPGSESAEVGALVGRENERRRAEYVAIAAANGTELRAVETVAGERRIAESASGSLVMLADGVWRPKP